MLGLVVVVKLRDSAEAAEFDAIPDIGLVVESVIRGRAALLPCDLRLCVDAGRSEDDSRAVLLLC